MDERPDKPTRMAQEWCAEAEIIRMGEDGIEIARIAEKVSRPLQEVEAVNGDPRELAFGYWILAMRMREDMRTLLKIGWGL